MQTRDCLLAVITRLNLNCRKSVSWQGLDPAWLQIRLELMQRFLLPSLRMQEDQDFVWLVLVHPDTPQSLFTAIQEVPQAHIMRTALDLTEKEILGQACVRYLHEHYSARLLITARIDSDDGIAADFGKRLKQLALEQTSIGEGVFSDFPRGAIYNIGREMAYLVRSRSRSCGVAKIEPFSAQATTIYCGPHHKIANRENCISTDTDHPMWVQTTHDFHINRRNKVLPKVRRGKGSYRGTKIVERHFPYLATPDREGWLRRFFLNRLGL